MKHLYFMPGMAASPLIFEHIHLPEDEFSMHFLSWEIPYEKESLSDYALRMTQKIKHSSPVLIGVSFGGVLVQEMARHITVDQLVIISSVKSKRELPRRMKLSRKLKLYKILPTRLIGNIDKVAKYVFGVTAKHRVELYKKYLAMNEVVYLDWALEKMICWDQKEPPIDLIHIHGDADRVFPFRYIEGCIRVPGGTHIMILAKHRWFNENLPKILSENA
ncbi:alpha/beta hydrolase [Croceiramulus getboli]|nr:alpha/beta hydrolase [Flavobacteriaceae bacterium YJPT1-3]